MRRDFQAAREQAQVTADRYISRDGGPGTLQRTPQGRTAERGPEAAPPLAWPGDVTDPEWNFRKEIEVARKRWLDIHVLGIKE